jgi:hypothetical protein
MCVPHNNQALRYDRLHVSMGAGERVPMMEGSGGMGRHLAAWGQLMRPDCLEPQCIPLHLCTLCMS